MPEDVEGLLRARLELLTGPCNLAGVGPPVLKPGHY